MITQEINFIIDNINLENKTISIKKVIVIKDDGVEIARSAHRCAFVPGQIDQVKDYLGVGESPEISYLESIWTQEVIDNYNVVTSQSF